MKEQLAMMMKRIVLIVSFFNFLIVAALAQTLTGRAPAQVAVGEQFRLSYTVNTDDAKGFRAGDIPDAFDVLMGPSTSQQSSSTAIHRVRQVLPIPIFFRLRRMVRSPFPLPM